MLKLSLLRVNVATRSWAYMKGGFLNASLTGFFFFKTKMNWFHFGIRGHGDSSHPLFANQMSHPEWMSFWLEQILSWIWEWTDSNFRIKFTLTSQNKLAFFFTSRRRLLQKTNKKEEINDANLATWSCANGWIVTIFNIYSESELVTHCFITYTINLRFYLDIEVKDYCYIHGNDCFWWSCWPVIYHD